jgi:hypothetical protein
VGDSHLTEQQQAFLVLPFIDTLPLHMHMFTFTAEAVYSELKRVEDLVPKLVPGDHVFVSELYYTQELMERVTESRDIWSPTYP